MMNRVRRGSPALALLVVIPLTGCGNYMKRAEAPVEGQEDKTLIVEMKTRFGAQANSPMGAALQMGTAGVLSSVGKEALPKIQSALGELGFATDLDEAAGKALRDDMVFGGGTPAVLSGQWLEPRTAYLSDYNSLLGYSYRMAPAEVVEKSGRKGDFKYYALVAVDFWDDGLLYVMKWPRAELRVNVFDESGKQVFESSSEGTGSTGFIVPNRSKAALTEAVDNAIAKLKTLKAEPL